MNVTKLKEEEVFRERTDIDEFDVNNTNKLDAIMLKQIGNSKIREFENARDNILKCFNNAYYIAILILNDAHTEFNIKHYVKIAGKVVSLVDENNYINYEYYYYESMTMAMVYNYVLACDIELNSNGNHNPTLKAIYEHYEEEVKQHNSSYHDAFRLFFNNIIQPDNIKAGMVNKELFYPKLPLEDTPAEVVIKQQNEKIKELENEIEFLSTDIPTVDVGDKSQRAYIARLLIEKMKNVRQNDRTQWAIVMSAITGASPSTCRNMFSTEPNMDTIKDDDKKKINNAFNKLEIDITI